MAFMGCVVYLLFGRANVQEFNTYWEKDRRGEKDMVEENSRSSNKEVDGAPKGKVNRAYDSEK